MTSESEMAVVQVSCPESMTLSRIGPATRLDDALVTIGLHNLKNESRFTKLRRDFQQDKIAMQPDETIVRVPEQAVVFGPNSGFRYQILTANSLKTLQAKYLLHVEDGYVAVEVFGKEPFDQTVYEGFFHSIRVK